MKQPELGKKISEIRLAKGLTQTELAGLCNVSLRTIQRIESAEVTPRSYTVKTIFSALGQTAYDSTHNSVTDESMLSGKLRQYRDSALTAVSELFNLKTHTMKKVTLLLMPLLMSAAIYAFNSVDVDGSQSDDKAAIVELNAQLVNLFNNGEFDQLGQLFLDEATISPAGYPEVSGRENIIGFYKILHQSGFRMKPSTSKSIKVNGNSAVDSGRWNGTLKGDLTGGYLTHWKKANGKWQIENDVTNVEF